MLKFFGDKNKFEKIVSLFPTLHTTAINTSNKTSNNYLDSRVGSNHYKGQLGKVCVIGGSELYTGAAYFSAISSLKIGAELAFVICPDKAALPIKVYSPELMVAPYLDSNQLDHFNACSDIVKKSHSIIVGPGLGRNLVNTSKANLKSLINVALKYNKNIIFDADGLWYLKKDTINGSTVNQTLQDNKHLHNNSQSIFRDGESFDSLFEILSGSDCSRVILTPNFNEFVYMLNSFFPSTNVTLDNLSQNCDQTKHYLVQLNQLFPNSTILLKGQSDTIVSNQISDLTTISHDIPCLKRFGGQGDILTGIIAVFIHYQSINSKAPIIDDKLCAVTETNPYNLVSTQNSLIDAVIAASYFVKSLTSYTFDQLTYSSTAVDSISYIDRLVKFIYDYKQNLLLDQTKNDNL